MARPTSYRPDLADALALHLSEGGSITSFAASVGIDRATLKRWKAKRPELALAALKPASLSPPPPVSLPVASPVISLAAWGIPHRTPTPIGGRIITDEDVDDMLAEAA